MPVSLTYPGVYIEEIPSGVRTITGVSTSVTAFVGYTKKGPINKAVKVFNFSEYASQFGDLSHDSELGYAVSQFFLNGGSEAWIVRVTKGGGTASVSVKNGTAAASKGVLTISAKTAGSWANTLGLAIDYDTSNRESTFNLTVTEYVLKNDTSVAGRTEIHRNLSMDSLSSQYAVNAINAGSELIQVARHADVTDAVLSALPSGYSLGGDLTALTPADLPDEAHISITVNGDGPYDVKIYDAKPAAAGTLLQDIAAAMQAKIRAIPSAPTHIQTLTVDLADATGNTAAAAGTKKYLRVTSGVLADRKQEHSSVRISAAVQNDAGKILKLGLDNGGTKEVEAASALRPMKDVSISSLLGTVSAPFALAGLGSDGDPPDAAAISGNRLSKTGMYALEDVDIFNILCIPRTSGLIDTEAKSVISAATAYCREKRAFYIVDPPQSAMLDKNAIKTWVTGLSGKSNYTALYFPCVKIPDPLDKYRLHAFPPSGTIAGLYARTDSNRGVWKAPAGTDASLAGVQGLQYVLSDMENGDLNKIAVNCIRSFPVTGIVSWGARSLMGADATPDDYKYIPVRRVALYIEQSLYRGTQWVVFEPNDEPLWAQIRLNIGAFMHDLFKKGAFQGTMPKDAYFVKCDKETTTQNDINLGRVNIIVGFAPLKPAEFVVIQIQQIAGQIQT